MELDTTKPFTKSPTVIDGFVQPGLPARAFTCLLFDNCMVFCKTGSFGPNSAHTMRTALGGYTGDGLIMSAIGEIIDSITRKKRVEKASSMVANDPESIAMAHKRNLLVYYDDVKKIEIKGPNFAQEVSFRIYTNTKKFKFRLDGQSKSAAKSVREIFAENVPEIKIL